MKRLAFLMHDGGRHEAGFSGQGRDCVVRALAILLERPYIDVYREVRRRIREEHLAAFDYRWAEAFERAKLGESYGGECDDAPGRAQGIRHHGTPPEIVAAMLTESGWTRRSTVRTRRIPRGLGYEPFDGEPIERDVRSRALLHTDAPASRFPRTCLLDLGSHVIAVVNHVKLDSFDAHGDVLAVWTPAGRRAGR